MVLLTTAGGDACGLPLVGYVSNHSLKLASDHCPSLKLSCKTVGQYRNPDGLIGSNSRYHLLEIESLRERNIVVASVSSQTSPGEKEEASVALRHDLYLLTSGN